MLLLFCLLLTGSVIVGNAFCEVPTIRVLNWSEYVALDESKDPDLPIEDRAYCLSEFAERNGCRIEYFEYEETVEAFSRIRSNEGFYDVVIASMGEVKRMREGGFLERFDKSRIRNHRYIPLFYNQNDEKGDIWEFAMPYLYGTTGIAYRVDLVPFEVNSWKQLFVPDESLHGKVAIMNDSQVMYGLASIYSGKDPNQLRKSDYRSLTQYFIELRKGGYLREVSSNVDTLSKLLNNGELAMAVMYSGDALAASVENPRIKYVVPNEGAEVYIDSLSILKDAPQKDLAYKFVDFMLDPEVNARNSIDLNYPTLNLAALSVIEKERPDLLENPDIYPMPDMLLKLKEFSAHSAVQQQSWNRFLNED